MNTQSISPSISLSQNFLMKFGSGKQPNQNESIKNTQQSTPSNQLAKDSYQPSKIEKPTNGSPVNAQKPNMSFTRSESIEMQFTTKEGDVVKISFKRTESRGPGTQQKEKDVMAETKKSQPASAPKQQTPITNNNKVATPVVKNVDSEKNNSAPKSLVASSQNNFQIEQDDKKLTGSKSEKYTFEPNNIDKQKEDFKKPEVSKASSKTLENRNPVKPAIAEVDKKIATDIKRSNDTKVQPSANKINRQESVETKLKPAVANPKDAPQATISNNEGVTNKGNSIQMQQSFSGVEADGRSVSFSSGFSLNIEGDLNQEELESITNLMTAMSEVSQSFFQGTAGNVFSQAGKMGFEADQIAGFSMSANKQQSVNAVAAYQQTAMPEKSIDTNVLSEASEFLSQAKEAVTDSAVAVESFAEPKSSFVDMFANIGQLFTEATDKQDNQGDMFLKMVENISNEFFGTEKAA